MPIMNRICICGGGSLGHVTAGYIAAKKGVAVDILTRNPGKWSHRLTINTPDGKDFTACISRISDNAAIASDADIVLLCLPGYAIKDELLRIAPHIKPGTFVGSIFSSTGFFFEAMEILPADVPLWGFQRVPFIARTQEYGHSANILGYKPSYNIAAVRCSDEEREDFRRTVEYLFDAPTRMLNSHYEASFTNSNPILHPSRLYSLFADWNENVFYDHQFLFYEEWNDSASQLLIELDKEFFGILAKLPVASDYLPTILDYYESHDAQSLTRKICSIEGFKGIKTPMIESDKGWQPDLSSRYFREDFLCGLRYIYETAHKLGIATPTIDRVYNWGCELARKGRG